MNKKKIAFGIGIVLAVLAAFTASAAATNVAYFDPDPSCAAPGEIVYVELRLNSTQGVACMETDIYFDPNVLNITNATPGDFPEQFGFGHHGNFVAMGGVEKDWLELPPGDYLFANLTFEAKNAGTSALTYDRNHLWDEMFDEIFDVIWNDGTFKCPCGVPEDINVTNADINVSGTVSGNHTLTHTSNNVSENITEEVTKGKPSKRISRLEHKWTIDVIGGTKNSVTFHVEAWHTENTEDDHFRFAYSTSLNGTYTPMVNVTKTSDDHTCQTAPLPNETSGTVYIRVMDTDRTGGSSAPDTIFIDHMFIRSVPGEPDEIPPVITNVTSTPSYDSAIIEWDTDEPADSLVKYGTESENLNMSKNDTTYETPHSIELTGLESNTTYYYVVNSTDPSENSAESDEYNFTTESEPSKSDLVITKIWCEAANKPNTYYIYYNIENQGGVEAGKSVSNWTIDSNTGTDKVATLAPGQTRKEKITYGGTPQNVTVCADCNKEIGESNEANNCLTNSSCTP